MSDAAIPPDRHEDPVAAHPKHGVPYWLRSVAPQRRHLRSDLTAGLTAEGWLVHSTGDDQSGSAASSPR